jgi:hypothetical protein
MDKKRKSTDAEKKSRREPAEQPSKGQYGGLKSLGPGGGRDIEDATHTEDIDPDDVKPTR